MGIYAQKATGKARCRKCRNMIKKGTIDVYSVNGWAVLHYHKKCILKEIRSVR